jgi:hypothetical protein
MEDVQGGTDVAVLGSYEGYLYVQSPDGNTGWMAGDATLSGGDLAGDADL